MNKEKKQKLVRIIAIVLVAIMLGSTVLSILVSAFAEESASARNEYEINMHYMEDEQALQITQRLVYHHRADFETDRVLFYATGNLFRRESALMYESDVLPALFPDGYAPAGIDLQAVRVNGERAEWAYQGKNELTLRVACELAPGEACVFEFDYYLLLSGSNAFLGAGETDVRLSAFYFAPGMPDAQSRSFLLNAPLQHTRWLWTDAADYRVLLTLPEQYLPAATGTETLLANENHTSAWMFEAENVREFALSFGRRYRETETGTESGVTVRCLTNLRGASDDALACASELIGVFENRFGAFPCRQLDIVQSDYPVDALNFPGAIWLPEAILTDSDALKKTLGFCLAQQYLGLTACAEPVADAWLSDVPCAYLSLLAIEETDGYDAFVRALNDEVLDALNVTVPGGLFVTADASLFSAEEYDIIVRDRGTVVMHELRLAMGREAFIDAMRLFFEMGLETDCLGEYDFVAALDEASGGSWENFLTEWLFNVDDYIGQQIEFYE